MLPSTSFTLLIVVVVVVIVLVTINSLRRTGQALQAPPDSPLVFLRTGSPDNTTQIVVCAGDSITHGMVSANYVDLLRARFAPQGYAFINAGINGNLAYNVLHRLNEIIACQPTVVTLLVGTNDVNATLTPALTKMYINQQKLPQPATPDWYRQNVETLIDRLQAEAQARIAILSLPPLGEDLDSVANQRVREYSATLREIAAAKQVAYLPLNERLTELLPANLTPPPYTASLNLAGVAAFKRFILRRSWDSIATEHRLTLLTDHIHLNDRAAAVLADLIGEFLTSQNQPAN